MKFENRDIFEQIGTLFYAIAAEQHVKPLEVAELKMLISRDWLPRTLDQTKAFASDETHFILTTMDTLQASETLALDAFNQFVKFYRLHPEVFTRELTQRILGTAMGITRVFRADNPQDNANLVSLKALFRHENVNS
jgi:hypothetical protein